MYLNGHLKSLKRVIQPLVRRAGMTSPVTIIVILRVASILERSGGWSKIEARLRVGGGDGEGDGEGDGVGGPLSFWVTPATPCDKGRQANAAAPAPASRTATAMAIPTSRPPRRRRRRALGAAPTSGPAVSLRRRVGRCLDDFRRPRAFRRRVEDRQANRAPGHP